MRPSGIDRPRPIRRAAIDEAGALVREFGVGYVSGYTAPGFLLWWLRARDMSRTIDGVLAEARFAASVDRSRIGAAGFSLGGYTVLEVAGARTSLERFTDYCDRTQDIQWLPQPLAATAPPQVAPRPLWMTTTTSRMGENDILVGNNERSEPR
jgi:fermentation-respiration switch protein FrsA (DUF1100 family)